MTEKLWKALAAALSLAVIGGPAGAAVTIEEGKLYEGTYSFSASDIIDYPSFIEIISVDGPPEFQQFYMSLPGFSAGERVEFSLFDSSRNQIGSTTSFDCPFACSTLGIGLTGAGAFIVGDGFFQISATGGSFEFGYVDVAAINAATILNTNINETLNAQLQSRTPVVDIREVNVVPLPPAIALMLGSMFALRMVGRRSKSA